MTTTEEKIVALDDLMKKRAELMATIGQAAVENDAKKMDAAIAERRKTDKLIADFATNAEKSARDEAIPLLSTSLQTIDMKMSGEVMPHVVLSGTLRRGEQGLFDDLKIGVGISGELDLSKILYDALDVSSIQDLSSVKGITFEVGRDTATISYTGRAPSGQGGGEGTGGKGWYKDGVKHTLNDVFEMRANDEDREKLAQAEGDGNKTWAVKNAVAKRQDDFALGE